MGRSELTWVPFGVRWIDSIWQYLFLVGQLCKELLALHEFLLWWIHHHQVVEHRLWITFRGVGNWLRLRPRVRQWTNLVFLELSEGETSIHDPIVMFTEGALSHIGFFAHSAAQQLHATIQADIICLLVGWILLVLLNLQFLQACDPGITLGFRACLCYSRGIQQIRRAVMAQLRCNSLLNILFRYISWETAEFSRTLVRTLIVVMVGA